MNLFECFISSSLNVYSGVELMDHNGSSICNFLKKFRTVFRSDGTNLHSHQQCMKVPFSPHPHQHCLCVFFLMIGVQTG